MSEFKRLKPMDEVRRLRKWGPGRVAQLKLFIGHLENAFESSLAAQVVQSNKRKFSEFVPKVVSQDITSEIEFRELRIRFAIPKGLRNFLFYELQLSLTENFGTVELFVSNDPTFVFSNLIDGTTYYFRVRVVTKDGLFGPWSDTLSATTPFSQAFGLTDGTVRDTMIFGDSFLTIFSRDYTAIGGKTYWSIEYEIEAQRVHNTTHNVDWSDVELQWLLDDKQVGQNFLVTTYRSNNSTTLGSNMEVRTADIGTLDSEGSKDSLQIPGQFSFKRRGAFTQKFNTLTADTTHTIKLNARVLPSSSHPSRNDFVFDSVTTNIGYEAGMFLRLKNFNIFEALVSD